MSCFWGHTWIVKEKETLPTLIEKMKEMGYTLKEFHGEQWVESITIIHYKCKDCDEEKVEKL